MKWVTLGRQVTQVFVMERGGQANAAPNDWQECQRNNAVTLHDSNVHHH